MIRSHPKAGLAEYHTIVSLDHRGRDWESSTLDAIHSLPCFSCKPLQKENKKEKIQGRS